VFGSALEANVCVLNVEAEPKRPTPSGFPERWLRFHVEREREQNYTAPVFYRVGGN
jgi:hypothetical protein